MAKSLFILVVIGVALAVFAPHVFVPLAVISGAGLSVLLFIASPFIVLTFFVIGITKVVKRVK